MWSVIIIIACLILLYLYLNNNLDYWKKKGVFGPKPALLVGNFRDFYLFKRNIGNVCSGLYEKYPNENYIGIFNARTPILLIRDPELIQHVLIKDFTHFTDRGLLTSNETLGSNLFKCDGESWKILRKNLTPVFSSSKLKNMFYLIHKCAVEYMNYVEEFVDRKEETEFRKVASKYTLGVICSCAFGIEADALKRGENIFEDIGKRMFETTYRETLYRILDKIFPGILRMFNLSVDPPGCVEFFNGLVKQIVAERGGKPKVRQDFMDLILNLREQGTVSGGMFEEDDYNLVITDTIIAAQAAVFFAAGFETSSGTMAFMVHELALHQEIQEKLRNEINEISVKCNGITYDGIQEMYYMDMVISETLRKYPPGDVLFRECVKTYQIPGTNITIDKGVKVIIPVFGLHRDPLYYPEPDKFDPERFAHQNKQTGIPYMPFGDGPRNCIALRFAKLQSMLGMALFLQRFRVSPSHRTIPDIEFEPKSFTLTSANGIWVNISKV